MRVSMSVQDNFQQSIAKLSIERVQTCVSQSECAVAAAAAASSFLKSVYFCYMVTTHIFDW